MITFTCQCYHCKQINCYISLQLFTWFLQQFFQKNYKFYMANVTILCKVSPPPCRYLYLPHIVEVGTTHKTVCVLVHVFMLTRLNLYPEPENPFPPPPPSSPLIPLCSSSSKNCTRKKYTPLPHYPPPPQKTKFIKTQKKKIKTKTKKKI